MTTPYELKQLEKRLINLRSSISTTRDLLVRQQDSSTIRETKGYLKRFLAEEKKLQADLDYGLKNLEGSKC